MTRLGRRSGVTAGTLSLAAMRSPITVFGITLLAWACGSADGPPPEPMTPSEREGLCEGIDNYYECSRVVEDNQLDEGASGVRRAGDTLVIGLAGDEEKRLVDRGENAETVLYAYGGYLERIGYHVVTVHFYEGSAHILIRDATGEETRVAGPPVVSPRARRIAIASYAGVAGYSPDLLQLWRVTPEGLAVEWEVEPDDWGAEGPEWVDTATVRFTRLSPCEAQRECRASATLRLEDGEWAVVVDPTP